MNQTFNSEQSNNGNTKTAYVVSHTHWDREWRYPIWQTQLMLVDFIDELVGLLEKDIYPGFLLDGQVSPVYDYLEFQPHMKDRIEDLVKSGKLEIGPWYTLPDEYPVDGECLVRNLLIGHRMAERLGRVCKIGYTSFGWGQTAQLAQIYGGFGIDVAMVGKRVDSSRAPNSEFLWKSPDGTTLLTSRFGELGRQNMYLKLHMSCLFGLDHESSEWQYDWSKGGIGFHYADPEKMEQDHFKLDSPGSWHPEFLKPELIEALWQTTDPSVLENDRLMMNGCDYAAAQPMFKQMLEEIKKTDPDKNRKWVHTTLSKFIEIIKSKIDQDKLAVVEGELRDGPAISITGNALTTHMDIKRLNKRAQNKLIRSTEPLFSLCQIHGIEVPKVLLDKAWIRLLEAQAHDSINGVTQDQTVIDVKSRLNEVISISEAVADRSLKELVKNIDMTDFASEDVLLVVFNPLPYARREVLEAWVNMPKPQQYSYLIPPPDGLQIYDAEDNALDTQWDGMDENEYPVAEIHSRAFPYYCNRHRVFFDSGEIPAGGYKIFRAGPIEKDKVENVHWSDSISRTDNILKSPNVLENKFLRVEMNANGTFNLTDKRTDKIFEQMNYYQDSGELGTYWVNTKPRYNKTFNSLGCQSRIWSEEEGPLQATLVSEIIMTIPQRAIECESRRSEGHKDLKIKTYVSLQKDSDRVMIKVEFENRCENHYLKVMFPTGLSDAEVAHAGGHFTVDKRPIKPQGPTENAIWPDMGTLPHANFVDISDGSNGIAFINDCLTEYQVLDNHERTVALSLLRSVKNWICTERVGSDFPSQKEGQCLGKHSYSYAIKPHKGTWQNANIATEALCFNSNLIPIQTRHHSGKLKSKAASLFEIENQHLQFSALKPSADSEDSWILRLFNPTEEVQKGALRFDKDIKKAWLTDLNEKRLKDLQVDLDGSIQVEVSSQKIISVEFKIK